MKTVKTEGIFAQIRNKRNFIYTKGCKITVRHIALVMIDILGEYYMQYSGNKVTTEEELDIEVEHFFFLLKYNLFMKTTIKRTEEGSYQIDNIKVNTTYIITHLEGEEPKIEEKDGTEEVD